MKTSMITITASLLFLFSAIAQNNDVKNHPGYIDFGSFSEFEGLTGVTEVLLDEDLLSTLAEISTDDDPNIMAILQGIILVKANVFEVTDENKNQLMQKIESVDAQLSGSEWKRIVKTSGKEEIANVYIKQNSNKKIIGLVVTTLEENGESAFVNVVGEFDLSTLGKLGKKFNIPHLNGDHKKES